MDSPALPSTGFLREADIVGRKAISSSEARANRRAGKRGRRPREARPALVPISSATLWRMVQQGRFPRPVRLSDGVTAWSVESVRDWIQSQSRGRA